MALASIVTPAPLPVATPTPANELQLEDAAELQPDDSPDPLPTLMLLEKVSTLRPDRLTRAELRSARLTVYPDVERPRTRGDCADGPRPCPFVSCAHHLYLDVNPETGSVKFNFPTTDVSSMAESCSLDVADRGGITLEALGELFGLTRERVRQIEVSALWRARCSAAGRDIELPEHNAAHALG